MPGSSLWLVPPPTHPLHDILTTLITRTLPARFPLETSSSPAVEPHFFAPHVTLTSEIAPAQYNDNGGPQAWLDSLPFPSSSSSSSSSSDGAEGEGEGGSGSSCRARIRFERVVSQDVFFRRCFVRVGWDEGVRVLAGIARAKGVLGEEVEVLPGGRVRLQEGTERWLSEWREAYGPHLSLMYGDVPITDETLKEVTRVVQEAGVVLSEETPAGTDAGGRWDGWDGGVIWLVPTDKPIAEWKPIATRQL